MAKKTKKVKISYGDEVIVTKGFFKGLIGHAVDIDNEYDKLASKFGIQSLNETRYKVKFNKDNSKHWFDAPNLKIIKKRDPIEDPTKTFSEKDYPGYRRLLPSRKTKQKAD